VFRRSDLSGRAKGLFGYLMTLPDDWVVHKREIYSHFTEGRDSLDAAWKELEDAGYIDREREREKGRITGSHYVVYESSGKHRVTENQLLGDSAAREKPAAPQENPHRVTEKPCDGFTESLKNRDTVNPHLLNTDLYQGLNLPNTHTPKTESGVPVQKNRYPVLDWNRLYDLVIAAGMPDPGGSYRLNIMGRDLLPYFDGLAADDIYRALENYGSVRGKPGSWWTSNPGILQWARKHLTYFLPRNFDRDYYYRARAGPGDNEADYYRRLGEKLEAGG
jgi:hypothetical protein